MGQDIGGVVLWYRYWFYGWLFLDANRGSVYERAAALRHNQSCSQWLPVYMGRWAILGLLMGFLGGVLEGCALTVGALPCFVVSVLSVPVNAVTLAAWLGLRWGSGGGG